MIFVLDSSAAVALLDDRPGADAVESVLADDEGTVYIHLLNLAEVFYIAHRRGALAAYLALHPQRQNQAEPDRPDLTGLDFTDETIFDAGAGETTALAALRRLDNSGVRTSNTFDAALWQDAARLKSQFRRVSLADCFGVALARRLDAEFVTSDRHALEALEAANIASFNFIR